MDIFNSKSVWSAINVIDDALYRSGSDFLPAAYLVTIFKSSQEKADSDFGIDFSKVDRQNLYTAVENIFDFWDRNVGCDSVEEFEYWLDYYENKL